MMNQGGIVIRLIDIVLNLLFGFISISEISSRSVIHLPKSEQVTYSLPDKEALTIIGITAEGKFIVEDETEAITDFNELKNYLIAKQEENEKNKIAMRVRIRSEWKAPIKYTLAVANLCDYLCIPKGMDVSLKGKNSSFNFQGAQ
jgi:biopolymer transport protein ExbD